MKFSRKNVLITGASKGIGAACARVLAGYGLKVWINYRSKPEIADSLAEEINNDTLVQNSGGSAAVIKFDASVESEFVEAVNAILSADGELGYLVNNAGITRDCLSLRMKADDFTSLLEANLTSAFIGSREALKAMKKGGGAVVNIASIVGEMGNAGQVNYSASKGGMIAMTKSFAKEGASRAVRYNAITPGFIESDMTAVLAENVREQYAKNIPLGRFGKAEEVAEAVAFLLSDSASYISGEVLRVNGGLLM